jgi:hypothetical protein
MASPVSSDYVNLRDSPARFEIAVVGYFESFLLGISSQTNMANAAAERIRSHHG